MGNPSSIRNEQRLDVPHRTKSTRRWNSRRSFLGILTLSGIGILVLVQQWFFWRQQQQHGRMTTYFFPMESSLAEMDGKHFISMTMMEEDYRLRQRRRQRQTSVVPQPLDATATSRNNNSSTTSKIQTAASHETIITNRTPKLYSPHWATTRVPPGKQRRLQALLPPAFPPNTAFPIPCRMDGTCPLHTTCAAVPNRKSNFGDKENDDTVWGVCVSWNATTSASTTRRQHSPRLRPCLALCHAELMLDERHLRHCVPEMVDGVWSEGVDNDKERGWVRPPGCILTYRRRPLFSANGTNNSETEKDDSIMSQAYATWKRTRHRHVVRVDPVHVTRSDTPSILPNHPADARWRAYCTAPCQGDADCFTSKQSNNNVPVPFVCHQGACKRNAQYWWNDVGGGDDKLEEESQQTPPGDDAANDATTTIKPTASVVSHPMDLTILTGTTPKYFTATLNFLASIRYWEEPKTNIHSSASNAKTNARLPQAVVVYNLGNLTEAQIQELEAHPNVKEVAWKTGIPEHYPHHVRNNILRYAWKPLAIYDGLLRYRQILWLDAGCVVIGPDYYNVVRETLERDGIFAVQGQDAHMLRSQTRAPRPGASKATEPSTATFAWFGTSPEQQSPWLGPSFAGGIQGHVYPSRYFDTIVRPNALCALDPDCIAPEGATLGRGHRFDQTALSILAHHPCVQLPHYTEYLLDYSNFDQLWTRPHERFLLTARGRNLFYYRRALRAPAAA